MLKKQNLQKILRGLYVALVFIYCNWFTKNLIQFIFIYKAPNYNNKLIVNANEQWHCL